MSIRRHLCYLLRTGGKYRKRLSLFSGLFCVWTLDQWDPPINPRGASTHTFYVYYYIYDDYSYITYTYYALLYVYQYVYIYI